MALLSPAFTYKHCIDASERMAWRIDEVLPEGAELQFELPHLPEALVNLQPLSFLNERAKLKLNHIRGHSYMNLFAFVEEYIIAQTVRHAEAEMFGDHDAVRALLRFGEEEIKHQALFLRYCEAFRAGFGSPCKVLGAAADVAGVILSKSPMAVMVTTLHLELMTQRHFIDAIKDDKSLDGLFVNILKHHWMEEAQHAKIDVLELSKMSAEATSEIIEEAIYDYFCILQAFDGLLVQQVDMDIESLETALQRRFSEQELSAIRASQIRSYRKDFLVMGMSNPLFVDTFSMLCPQQSADLARRTAAYAEGNPP